MDASITELKDAIQLIQEQRWDDAHEIVQVRRDSVSSWIHAWLHRQEGDLGNASYWYDRAGQPFPEDSLEEELNRISSFVDTME